MIPAEKQSEACEERGGFAGARRPGGCVFLHRGGRISILCVARAAMPL